MKLQTNISTIKINKRPFIQNGRKDTFIQSPAAKKNNINRAANQENKANDFAQTAAETPEIVQSFLSNPIQQSTHQPDDHSGTIGNPLSPNLIDAFKIYFDQDFSDVYIHNDKYSTQLALEHQAGAFTINNHIFLNQHAFEANNINALLLLSHELYHTIQAPHVVKDLNIQLKPLSELNDRTPEQSAALERAAKIAQGEKGKINSGALNEDKTRVGWEFLLEYFKTTLGEDTIVKDKSEYKPGKFLQENIQYVRKGKVQVVKVVNGAFKVTVEDNVDVLPSWCGIFAFWALHKAGIHPPKWEFGKPNFTGKDQYKKGEYLPRVGDIVIKNGFNHHALVVKTEPEQIADTKELKNVQVITINGNTLGNNHQGGQIQQKSDPYSYWDYYVNPFFQGVSLTDAEDYKVDERLKKSLGETPAAPVKNVDLSINQYNSALQPIGNLDLAKKDDGQKEAPEIKEESKLDPKEIMAKDDEFKTLHTSLKQNAAKKAAHDLPENKVNEAQNSAISPGNERLSKAKAVKIETLGALPKPKQFNGEDLKKNILKEVDQLLKQKEAEAGATGEKPKIKEDEIKDVKSKNNAEIQNKKAESIGQVEHTHKKAPDEAGIEERKNIDVVAEDAGKKDKISGTEKAVAKPVADERITLEKESGKIDDQMAENDVDEKQLEESDEENFTATLNEKRESQAEAANVKQDYRSIENEKLEKDKKNAWAAINDKIEKIYQAREGEFGKVNAVKENTKSADELKRKEISDNIEKIYTASEESVKDKLNALETTVNEEFDSRMATANKHFKENINNGLDEEFTWEFAAKHLDRDDYNRRVRKVFIAESEKYKKELSDLLDPLTQKMAQTLNAIIDEIAAAKNAVIVYVNGLAPSLQEIGVESAKAVLDKFNTLEESVNEKQEALTSNLAKRYADGVSSLEEQFKQVMDSRKSWLERAYDAVVKTIKEIINLLADLKKALERAAGYATRIIKSPRKFFNNLVQGATEGFNSFVKNIDKHLLQGALEWITGEMSEAGIQLPEKFDFKGILSIILQVLGITIANVKETGKKVLGAKYVTMLEKGVDIGMNVGEKIFKIFTIIKNEGLVGLWEFIKEQFNDLKEKLLEEAKSFIIVTIVEVAVVKLVSMLIPGAGFISAVKSLVDFLKTLFAKARQIVNIITGIIDTFGEILAGNVAKVSTMIQNVLVKFLGMAITFLAAILGLGKIGKKINDIIQKKIKDPINKAITKMMEKLKALMTRLGIFKLMDKTEEKIKKGKDWVEDKKEKVKDKAKEGLAKIKGFLKGVFNKYTDESGETHTLRFKDTDLYRESVSKTLGNYLLEVKSEINDLTHAEEKKKHLASVNKAFDLHRKIIALIGSTIKQSGGKYTGADKGFSPAEGEILRGHLQDIATILRTLPIKNGKKIIPKTSISYKEGVDDGIEANASLISLDSDFAGSQPAGNNSPLSKKIIDTVLTKKDNHNLVRGHLINHELYGTGVGTKNLAPIPKKANSNMLTNFEKDAKNLVHSNNIISLKVSMNYGEPNDKKWNGKSLLKKNLPGKKIPASISYNLNELKFSGTSNAKKEVINNTKNWKANGLAKADTIHINHDDFF